MAITLEYPSTLPLPINRLSQENSENSTQGDPNNGPAGIYKWSDQEYLSFSLVWSMTQDELKEFLEFFNTTLNVGSRWFLMDLQWMVNQGGQTRQLECNFNGLKPDYSNTGKRRRITSSVIVRNPYRDSQDFYDQFIDLVVIENLENFLDRLAIFANEDMPENIPG